MKSLELTEKEYNEIMKQRERKETYDKVSSISVELMQLFGECLQEYARHIKHNGCRSFGEFVNSIQHIKNPLLMETDVVSHFYQIISHSCGASEFEEKARYIYNKERKNAAETN